jgi:hypothetical protein
MDLTVHIPDDFASRMSAEGIDLSRRALEGLAIEEYRSGRLTRPELRRLLDFETRYELDGFLQKHGIYDGYTFEEIEQQVEDLKLRGF